MHPLLKVLDVAPGESLDSPMLCPHPVLAAAPASPRLIPGVASLVLTSMILGALTLGVLDSPGRNGRQDLAPVLRSVSIALTETAPTELLRRDASVPPGGSHGSAPSDGGSPRDAERSRTAEPDFLPSGDFDPIEVRSLPSADRSLQSLAPALSAEPGGKGLASGTGHGGLQGQGSGAGPGGRSPDYRIVAIREVRVFHQLKQGESSELKEPVRVRLTVGADGVPLEVTVLNGPGFLRKEVVNAALQWRFEPLALHGLPAPQTVVVDFYPAFSS